MQSYKKNGKMLRRALAFVFWGVLAACPAAAQRVGVVMSGGGAKGLYHIGVLEALEVNGIPVDCTAGTSMGSIIAAMYASGYSPAEMRAIVESGVVREWVSGHIDPNCMPYYRQTGRVPSFFRLRLDFRHTKPGKRFVLPSNLLSSTPVDMALMELFAPATAAAGGRFDDLMVPFLCVASDMNARRGVVLRDGDLAEAVRSSMSIPLVFKPMKVDSMLLYDGGIYDNFPWKPLDAEFAPDLIVGSVCTEGNTAPSENNNLMDQAFVLAMHDTDYDLPADRGVMLRRAVAVGMLDFDDPAAIMNMGYADAMEQMPRLLAAVTERRDSAWFAERRAAFRAKCPPLIFDDYAFEGLSRTQRAYVRDFVEADRRARGVQRQMGYDELKENLFGVLAGGDFTMDFPRARYDTVSGRYSFAARLATRPNFKVMVGGNVSSTAYNQAYLGVSYSTIGRVAHSWGGDLYLGPLYTWGAFGGRSDFYMGRYPLFLDYSFNFAVKNLRHGTFGRVSDVDNILEVKSSELFASVAGGLPLTRRSMLSLRLNAGHINYHYDSDEQFAYETDHSRFSYAGAKLEVARNTLDKPLYPRKGSHVAASVVFLGGRDKYQPYDRSRWTSLHTRGWFGARLRWDKYFDIPGCRWFSLGLNFDAVLTDQPRFSTPQATLMALPAYEPTAQSRMIFMPDFSARRFVAGGVMPTFDLLPDFFFRTGFYVMHRDKRDFVWREAARNVSGADTRTHYAVEASFVYHTSIGPVSLALTKYELKNWNNMYLTFNFGYAIFAPRGTFY